MSKITIFVYVMNSDYNGDALIKINQKQPRRYMLSWSFDKLLNYVKEECYWKGININMISCILFVNDEEHWRLSIPRPVLF